MKKISEMSVAELRARATEIRGLVDKPDADLEALDAEATEIAQRLAQHDAEQRRRAIAEKVSGGAGIEMRRFEDKPADQPYAIDSKEYRTAWLKHLQDKELTAAEQRAFTASNGAVSQLVVNDIMSVVRDHAPLLQRITMVYSAAKITYYIEGTNAAATDHTENAAITAATDTLTSVTLSPAEIVKLIQVSEAAKQMSIPVFHAWLTRMLGEAIARKINEKIISAMSTAATSAGTAITAATVQALLGTVKGNNIGILCNRKTLYTQLLPLQDNSKNSIVRFDGAGNRCYVYGVEVLPDDNVADNTVIAGDLPKCIGAMGEDINVREQYDIDTNSYKYLGVALFDTEVGIDSAFAKLVVSA